MNADMATYAAFEGSTAPATLVADAGSSLPASPNAAYLSAFHTASSAPATPAPSGLSKVGSLLSPLMLVTLAALPVGREEEDEGDKSDRLSANGLSNGQGLKNGQATMHTAVTGSLFNPSDDPLHLELLRSSYAI
jgi:hypothetical protein